MLSAPALQHIAEGAVIDGKTHPDITKLASLGTSGVHTRNAHLELQRWLRLKVSMPEPVWIKVPGVNPKGDRRALVWYDIPILLPNQVWHWIVTHYPKEFERMTFGNEASYIM